MLTPEQQKVEEEFEQLVGLVEKNIPNPDNELMMDVLLPTLMTKAILAVAWAIRGLWDE